MVLFQAKSESGNQNDPDILGFVKFWLRQLIADCCLSDTQAWTTANNVHTTPSAISVLQLLDHICGTLCPLNDYNLTVSQSSNGCWRRTCLGTTALHDMQLRVPFINHLTYLLNEKSG